MSLFENLQKKIPAQKRDVVVNFMNSNPEEIINRESGEIIVNKPISTILIDKRGKFDRTKIMRDLNKNKIFNIVNKTIVESPEDNQIINNVIQPEGILFEDNNNEIIFHDNEIEEDKVEEDKVEEDKVEEDKEVKPKKSTIIIKKKTKTKSKSDKINKPMDTEIEMETDPDELNDDFEFVKRLPKQVGEHKLKTSLYYMNNRKKFLSQLIPLFSKYKRELNNSDKIASCDNNSEGTSDFKLMIHQKVVRDYLNLYTPYRGLLLYHGLGSGKTCTSIAIAEGMKSQKRIYVLTLASLKANFFDQMKVCGDPIYKLDQFWEFVSIDGQPNYVNVLSKILSLSPELIRKNKGAWMVNVKKESNYQELTDDDKKNLNEQIDVMIRSKYTDINYNGMNKSKMDILTDNNSKNPFDNSVVIIDEVHNFVSRIVNRLRDKTSISYKLYEYLMSATNARIVLLSGTPIINYPNEIGILFNILRGYIKTWTFPFKITDKAEKPSRDAVLSWFKAEKLNRYDYVDLTGQKLIITRNPFGFENNIKPSNNIKKGGNKTKKNNKTKSKNNKTKSTKDSDTDELNIFNHKNGLISINSPLDNSKLDETNDMRQMRINTELDTQTGGSVFNDYSGVEFDDTGNMSDIQFKKVIISILGKHGLIIDSKSVTTANNKALPDVSKEFLEMFVELGAKDMKNERVFQKRILGLTSYFKGADDNLYPSFVPSEIDTVYNIENVPMSEYQFGVYEQLRDSERKLEKQTNKSRAKNKDAEELFKIPSTYRIASRMGCNFAFPDPPGRPRVRDGEKGSDDEIGEEGIVEEHFDNKRGKKKGGMESNDYSELSDEEDEEDEEEEPEILDLKNAEDIILDDIEDLNVEDNMDYPKRMAHALNEIKLRSSEILSKAGLKMYSPKFLRILENIKDEQNTGLHLLYSQFRSMEGIGIFKLVLEENGFAEFKIRKFENEWILDINPDDIHKPKFALHTGTETDEEKKIILNIYNSKWNEVPSKITAALNEQGHENNHMGQAIRVLMITASGAEGINLKNTRFVHIMEPYWNMVRLSQVIGRARRICSHQDLPDELRTVKVFLYMSVLSDKHSEDVNHIELRLRDKSKLSKKTSSDIDESTLLGRYVKHLKEKPGVVTTDQQLFENALIKDHVNSQILNAVKETSMDCRLYE